MKLLPYLNQERLKCVILRLGRHHPLLRLLIINIGINPAYWNLYVQSPSRQAAWNIPSGKFPLCSAIRA